MKNYINKKNRSLQTSKQLLKKKLLSKILDQLCKNDMKPILKQGHINTKECVLFQA